MTTRKLPFFSIIILLIVLTRLFVALRDLAELTFLDYTFDLDRLYPSELITTGTGSVVKQKTLLDEKTLHVLNGIYLGDNNNTGIIDEWEVNLKSVLSNAPVANDLHVHVLTNNDATKVIEERIKATGLLDNSRWRNKVSLTLYNVESKIPDWTLFLNEKLRDQETDERTSIGGYFRLLAYTLLKERGVDEVLYMDVDVVVLANLNDLLQIMNTTHDENKSMMWQYASYSANSGFVVLNMQKFHIFWDLVSKLPDIIDGGDQSLLAMVNEQWPSVYNGSIPDRWNIHLGHGFRRAPHRLYERNSVAMLHFTGGFGNTYFSDEGLDKYCGGWSKGRQRGVDCVDKHLDKFHSTWGLAEYYLRLSWTLLIYFESAKVAYNEEGFPFNFEVVNC